MEDVNGDASSAAANSAAAEDEDAVRQEEKRRELREALEAAAAAAGIDDEQEPPTPTPESTGNVTQSLISTGTFEARRTVIVTGTPSDVATEAGTERFPTKALSQLTQDAILEPQLSPVAELEKGVKHRSREAILREKQRIRTHAAAAERPGYKPTLAPKVERGDWNLRHNLRYSNDSQSQNTRCYFDRHIDYKPPGSDSLGPMKPSWRLSNDPVDEDERKATRAAAMSPTLLAVDPASASTAPPRAAPGARKAARDNRECPWEWPPKEIDDHSNPESDMPRRIESSEGGDQTPQKRTNANGELFKVGPGAAFFMPDNSGVAGVAKDLEVGGWDKHHAVDWCNFRNTGGKLLNPVQTRSYFDRRRNPAPSSRSCQTRHDAVRNSSTKESEGSPQAVGPIARALPVWRLEPERGSGASVSLGAESPLQRPRSILGHAGKGGATVSTSASRSRSMTVNSIDRPQWPTDLGQRSNNWNTRHQLSFKNEEVSRLDRCYFDRWREPDALLSPDADARQQRASCRVWSLEQSGTIEEAAATVGGATDYRHKGDGRWNTKHHLTFYNNIAQNARSYFDRHREIVDPTHPGIIEQPGDGELEPIRALTVAAEGRRRKKLKKEEQLPVKWKLQDYTPAQSLDQLLRRSESDPGSVEGMRHARRQSAWFSSHGIHFDAAPPAKQLGY